MQSLHDYSQLSPDTVIRAVESTGRFSDARVLALNSLRTAVVPEIVGAAVFAGASRFGAMTSNDTGAE